MYYAFFIYRDIDIKQQAVRKGGFYIIPGMEGKIIWTAKGGSPFLINGIMQDFILNALSINNTI